MRPAIFVFPLLEPASRAYGEKRSVRPGPISRSSGNAERLGRQAETAFRGGARWRSPVGACAAGRPGGSPRHMRRAPSPGPAAAPPEQRRDGRRSAGDIGSSSELSAHFDDARKINSWNPVRDAVRRSLPWKALASPSDGPRRQRRSRRWQQSRRQQSRRQRRRRQRRERRCAYHCRHR